MEIDLEKIKSIEELDPIYDQMQLKYGAKTLHSITNGGCRENPKICFVFMNPTGKNIASQKSWKGIRSPWIGTKNVWKLFFQLKLIEPDIYGQIQNLKANQWDEVFAEKVYKDVAQHEIFITNLGKCTQLDARQLSNRSISKIFKFIVQGNCIDKAKEYNNIWESSK